MMSTLWISCHSQSSLVTPIYGGNLGSSYADFWSYNLAATTRIEWKYLDESNYDWYRGSVVTHFQCIDSDANTSPKAGQIPDTNHPNLKSCTTIVLQANEYIDSYRIQSSRRVDNEPIEYIYGIGFKTSLSNTYSCGGSLPFYTSSTDSGWIYYDGYYLAGFTASYGQVLDAIGFCFINASVSHLNMEQNSFCNITPAADSTSNPTSILHTSYTTYTTVKPVSYTTADSVTNLSYSTMKPSDIQSTAANLELTLAEREVDIISTEFVQSENENIGQMDGMQTNVWIVLLFVGCSVIIALCICLFSCVIRILCVNNRKHKAELNHIEAGQRGDRLASILKSGLGNKKAPAVIPYNSNEGEAVTRKGTLTEGKINHAFNNVEHEEEEGRESKEESGMEENTMQIVADDEFVVIGNDETAGEIWHTNTKK